MFALGSAVGSFLNVVIHRLPVMMERDWKAQCREYMGRPPTEEDSDLSLAKPRSRCPDCGHAIRFYENIPVLSYLWLRGKCSSCRHPISLRYPMIELLTAVLSAVIAWHFGFGWQAGLLYEFSENACIGMVYRSEVDPDLSGKPKFQNIGPVLDGVLNATGLKDQNIDVKFKVPEMLQLGYYQAFNKDWSFTADALWINMSAFGINHVSVNSDMTSAKLSVDGSFRDMYIFTTGLRYQYRPDLAFSVVGAYATSATSDARRTIALPLDRVIAVGAGVEWECKSIMIQNNLNYADLGDGNLDQDNGLAGRVKGSFDKNYAVVLDTQITWRF